MSRGSMNDRLREPNRLALRGVALDASETGADRSILSSPAEMVWVSTLVAYVTSFTGEGISGSGLLRPVDSPRLTGRLMESGSDIPRVPNQEPEGCSSALAPSSPDSSERLSWSDVVMILAVPTTIFRFVPCTAAMAGERGLGEPKGRNPRHLDGLDTFTCGSVS